MTSDLEIPELRRPSFFDGQRLTAADLAAVQGFHRELRWLHNRSLHNWGIAFGLAVTGARGDRAVRVEPGYAIDCLGRDLVLGEAVDMAVPAVAGADDGGPVTYYLTASYADDSMLTPETREGLCDTRGAVRRPERPVLRWQDPSDIAAESRFRRGLDVVLATAQVQGCRLERDLSGTERRDAIPAQQPYVAAGQSLPLQTPWAWWPSASAPLGLSAVVTTSSAGFRDTPRYLAHVVGERAVTSESEVTHVVDGYAQVVNPSASSFEMRVILPRGTTVGRTPSYTVTDADMELVLAQVVDSIVQSTPNVAPLAGLLAQLVRQQVWSGWILVFWVGRPIDIWIPIPFINISISYTVTLDDLRPVLDPLAAANATTVEEIVDANGRTMQNMILFTNQQVMLPGTVVPLNPQAIFEDEDFPETIQSQLGWYVVWMGVEG